MKKIRLLPLTLIATATPVILLTSCAQQSQFLPNVKMVWNNKETFYASYAVKDPIIYDNTDEHKPLELTQTNKDKVKLFITGILPFMTITDKLVNYSHVVKDNVNQDLIYTDNLIFDQSETYENNAPKISFKEFMYASNNTLNQGRKNQIKLSLSQVNLTGLTENYLPYANGNKNIKVKKNEKPVELKEGEKLYVYSDTEPYYKEADATTIFYGNQGYLEDENLWPKFSMDLIYRYYDPQNSNAFKDPYNDINKIQEYVKNYNAWKDSGITPSKTEFTINLNVEITLRPKFEFSPYIIKKGDEKPTENEVKKLVKLDADGDNFKATLDFKTDQTKPEEYGTSDKFSNWIFEPKFTSKNLTDVNDQNSPLLAKLDTYKDKKGFDDFSNVTLLDEYVMLINSYPTINTIEDHNNMVKNISHFRRFIGIK